MTALFEKPFVLSIGPQRAGAQYIYDYFSARGDVCLPAGVKEICFFDRHFHRGAEFYKNHFPVRDKHELIAEVSTTAFDHPDSPARVLETLGNDIKIVCPLRNPITRSMAVYQDFLTYGIVTGTIEEAVEQAPQILYASRYVKHLENWFKVFDKNAIKILYYEKAEKDEEAYLRDLCAFIGTEYKTTEKPSGIKLAVGDMFSKFKPRRVAPAANIKRNQQAKSWLSHALLSEVLELESLLGQTIPHWKH